MNRDKNQYGLIGFPLKHSFSKKLFTEKFINENIDAYYSNIEIKDLKSLNKVLDDNNNLKGFNVTAPYKQHILNFLTYISDEARIIGAVNTVKVSRYDNNKINLAGYNTDVIGFRESVQPFISKLLENNQKLKALILGTGGASKAVSFALKQLDVEFSLVSRKENKTDNILSYSNLNKGIILEHKIIVNCTPLGTFPNIALCPNIPYDFITNEHLVYDLVYNPTETLFLNKAKANGAITKNGYEMLEKQALAAWKIWKN